VLVQLCPYEKRFTFRGQRLANKNAITQALECPVYGRWVAVRLLDYSHRPAVPCVIRLRVGFTSAMLCKRQRYSLTQGIYPSVRSSQSGISYQNGLTYRLNYFTTW